jgi:signal transduction histidine kinase
MQEPSHEPLQPHDLSALECLQRGKTGLLERWRKALGQRFPASPPQPILSPRAPEFVEQLIESLPEFSRTGATPPPLEKLAREHGQHHGEIATHPVEQLMAGFRVLRKVVSAALLECPSSERVRDLTHELVDQCVEHAVAGFLEARTAGAREELEKHQRRLSEQRRQEQEVEHALRMRDELLSVVSHELRSPLTALLLQLQLLQRTALRRPDHSLSGEELNRSLPRALQLATRLQELLDRLLDLSKLRTDCFGLEITTFDLRALLDDLVSRLQPQALAAGSSLEARHPGELFVDADPLRIEQVLTNLIVNAIKYGAGKPIEVTLTLSQEEAVMEVRDQGIGIPEQDQKRIFERFVRATGSHRGQSLGLGLYITREIVRAHGGTLEVESQPGQGSRFRVTLPTRRLG